MQSGIYLIKNLQNHKVYVGRSKNIKRRWRDHVTKLRKGTHGNSYLQHSWSKYGEYNFVFGVIEYCDTNVLPEKERFYMADFEALNKEKGYNFREETSTGKLSAETRAKISASRKKLIKENPEILNHLGTTITVTCLKTNTKTTHNSIKECKEYYKLTNSWLNNKCRKYINKLPYANKAFITNDKNYTKTLNIITKKWKQGEGYLNIHKKPYTPIYTINIHTQQIQKHPSFTSASKFLGKTKCLSKKFLTEDKYIADHVLSYSKVLCEEKIDRLRYRIGKGNRTLCS